MQPLLAPPRDSLTEAQIHAVLTDAESISVAFGANLYDNTESFLADISFDLRVADCHIERDLTTKLHTTGQIAVARRLEWGNQRVQPYVTVTGYTGRAPNRSQVSVTAYLGMLLLDTPSPDASAYGEYAVGVFDKLAILDTELEEPYQIDTSTPVLTAVAQLVADSGETKLRLDPAKATATHPTGKVYDVPSTRLDVINDLLVAIAYNPLATDWDGWFTSGAKISDLSTQSVEWSYDASDPLVSVVNAGYTIQSNYFQTPNVFIFRVSDSNLGLPSEGNGLYTVTNQSNGPTSVDARGRRIVKNYTLDADDQASLVTQADKIVKDAQRVVSGIDASVSPNPLHWGLPGQGDIVRFIDVYQNLDAKCEVTHWSIAGSGADMGLTLATVS